MSRETAPATGAITAKTDINEWRRYVQFQANQYTKSEKTTMSSSPASDYWPPGESSSVYVTYCVSFVSVGYDRRRPLSPVPEYSPSTPRVLPGRMASDADLDSIASYCLTSL